MMHPHALFLSYHVGRDENPGNYPVYHIRKMNRMVYLGCSSTEKNRHWPGKTWTLQVPPTPGITSCKIPLDMEVHMVLWIFPWNKTIQLWRYLHDYGTPATEDLSSGFTLAIGRQKTRTLICCSCSSVSSMARTIQGDVSANYRYSIYIYTHIIDTRENQIDAENQNHLQMGGVNPHLLAVYRRVLVHLSNFVVWTPTVIIGNYPNFAAVIVYTLQYIATNLLHLAYG